MASLRLKETVFFYSENDGVTANFLHNGLKI